MVRQRIHRTGFTLIELLVVIAIIAVRFVGNSINLNTWRNLHWINEGSVVGEW